MVEAIVEILPGDKCIILTRAPLHKHRIRDQSGIPWLSWINSLISRLHKSRIGAGNQLTDLRRETISSISGALVLLKIALRSRHSAGTPGSFNYSSVADSLADMAFHIQWAQQKQLHPRMLWFDHLICWLSFTNQGYPRTMGTPEESGT